MLPAACFIFLLWPSWLVPLWLRAVSRRLDGGGAGAPFLFAWAASDHRQGALGARRALSASLCCARGNDAGEAGRRRWRSLRRRCGWFARCGMLCRA